MTYILVTVTGGIIERVTFFDNRSLALRVLASFVKRMNPEEDDAAVFNRGRRIANAKDFLDETNRFIENGNPADEWVSDEENSDPIYFIANPTHRLGFMVVSPDDPLGFENPAEAVSELGQMRKEAGSHLKLYQAEPVEEPITTRMTGVNYFSLPTTIRIPDSPLPSPSHAG